MFGLRAALSGAARTSVVSPKVAPTTSFHTSACSLAKARRSRKDVAIQIRKTNLQKQEQKRLQFKGSTPDYTIGKDTQFTRSLLKPQTVFQSPLASIKSLNAETDTTSDGDSQSSYLNLSFSKSTSTPSIFSSSSRTPLVVSTSNPSGYQHFLNKQETELIFEKVPQIQLQEMMLRSTLVNEMLQLPIEKQKAELVRRITALENGNAKQITLENVRRAREAFQHEEGDTGSPEVQAANLTVKIRNMRKDFKKIIHPKCKHFKTKTPPEHRHSFYRLLFTYYNRYNNLIRLKKMDPERYRVCLDRLELDPRVIEDEMVI
ncbi:hypothetical protein BGZ65_009356 [Modicella reniformis]|uniref:Ribosomal protein S15 n=1 Tax=Modicella reniformis TaxID=1440133 RepID=A0A9P6SS04_9FUNG|nr:hypothetical protein BGZ65_009356 [Modicella reniformis]